VGDAISTARYAGQLDDGIPVRVQSGKPFQDSNSILVTAFFDQGVFAQALVSRVEQRRDDVVAGHGQTGLGFSEDDRFVTVLPQRHWWFDRKFGFAARLIRKPSGGQRPNPRSTLLIRFPTKGAKGSHALVKQTPADDVNPSPEHAEFSHESTGMVALSVSEQTIMKGQKRINILFVNFDSAKGLM